MLNNFFIYLKSRIFVILYCFVIGFAFMTMSFLFFVTVFDLNFVPLVFIDVFKYFWIEFIVIFLVLTTLILGGFLYKYSGINKNEISLLLLNFLTISFIYLFIASIVIAWNKDFYFNIYFITFSNYYIFTTYTFFLKLWIIFFSIVTLLISKNFLKFSKYNLTEYSVLIGFVSFLMIVLVSLIDLFAIFIVIESLFFLLLALSALKFSNITVEACTKYFIQNVFVSGLSLFGLLIIYFICKSTNIFIIKGVFIHQFLSVSENKIYIVSFLILGLFLFFLTFLFKIGLFPMHFYAPDLYEASTYSVIFFFSCVIKPIFLLFFLKLFEFFILNFFYSFYFLFFIAFFTVLIGLLGALQQFNIKRFLAYTSINQLGFLLFCFVCNSGNWPAVLIYSFIYCLFQIPFFFVMSTLTDLKQFNTLVNFSDFNKIFFSSSFKYVIAFCFFFISGLPPFLLFLYKYILLTQTLFSGYFIVIIFIIFMNVISLIYYLRIIKSVLFEEKNDVSVMPLKFVNVLNENESEDDVRILEDFNSYLSWVVFFSLYLFVYFDEIQIFVTTNSENFLAGVYLF